MKQNIIDKLKVLDESTRAIFSDFSKLSDEQLHARSGKSWSLIQVLSHLNQAESSSLMYMKKKIQAGDKMAEIGFKNHFQMKLTNLALSSSLKWKAPSYVANPPEVSGLKEMETIWMGTRNEIMKFVEEYPEKYLNKAVYKHPMGGRQNLNNAIDSFIFHQKHHEHQIKRIKKSLAI